MTAYLDAMLRYFEFSGRSSRTQYWVFWLVALLLSLLGIAADYYLFGIIPSRETAGPLGAFMGIIHVFPGITVTVRRLHDSGRSGWWYFLPLIPLIGSIIHLVMMCRSGDPADNEYGPAGDAAHVAGPAPTRMSASTTIPRQIRMGNSPARPAHVNAAGDVQRFI